MKNLYLLQEQIFILLIHYNKGIHAAEWSESFKVGWETREIDDLTILAVAGASTKDISNVMFQHTLLQLSGNFF
jgi:hypothetical protein